jgi:hypothetical protein
MWATFQASHPGSVAPKARTERDRKIAELQRENARLTARAEHAEATIEVQKVSLRLGTVRQIELAAASS